MQYFVWYLRRAKALLQDVTAIKKKKNCGFPNSIEISYSGKKDFFTSFLFREDAFRLLSYAWNRSNR